MENPSALATRCGRLQILTVEQTSMVLGDGYRLAYEQFKRSLNTFSSVPDRSAFLKFAPSQIFLLTYLLTYLKSLLAIR